MLRTRLPSSRGGITSRVSVFDAVWAFIAPLAALAIRDAYILSYDGLVTTLLYCVLSATFSLIAFLIRRYHLPGQRIAEPRVEIALHFQHVFGAPSFFGAEQRANLPVTHRRREIKQNMSLRESFTRSPHSPPRRGR